MTSHAMLAAALLATSLAIALPARAPAQSTPQLVAPPLMATRGAEVPIQVQSLAMTTDVHGGLARSTIEMTFHNPNRRPLEGELQFPLQPGQQVSGFALDVAGHMRAAVPVEKAKGQEVFEAIERRGVDPGLLQQTAGNQFKLRVFPIPANGERHVRIDIDQSLDRDGDGWTLRLPVTFARSVDSFQLRVIARGQAAAPRVVGGFGDIAFAKDGDSHVARIDGHSPAARNGVTLRFDAATQPQAFVQDVDGQRYFHAEVPLPGAAAARAMPRTIGLLWDSSASGRKRDIDGELALLDRYFAAVGNGEVRLTRLRDVPEATRIFAIRGGDWSALRKELRDTVYDGASALADWRPQPDVQDYLLVSDGFANYGIAREMPKLLPRQRLYALDSAGADSDTTRLAAWADARGGRLVQWRGSTGVADAAKELLAEGPRLLSLEGPGTEGLVAASRHPHAGYLRIAGRLRQPAATVTLTIGERGVERRITVPIGADAPASNQVAALWASYMIDAMAAEPELHRAEIRRIGNQFGLVSAETSLIVLENPADYLRYEIAPPPELREAVARLVTMRDGERNGARREHLDAVARDFAEKIAWWEKPWPKDRPAQPKESKAKDLERVEVAASAISADAAAGVASPPVMHAPPPPPPAPAARELDRVEVVGTQVRRRAVDTEPTQPVTTLTRTADATTYDVVNHISASDGSGLRTGQAGVTIGIAMQPWKPDSPFARRLRAAPAEQVYAVYLDERDDHADSSAFYLDVADILFERGQRSLALRVLSNLAEMNLENRQLLRVLGYRLMQARADALAVPVFEHVSRLAEEEPQSWRDLGLAYAAAGREQDAIDTLYRVVSGTWDSRFPSVELIALGELDAIVARARHPLDTRAIDRRLLRNLPLDLRVVLSWDSDNTDIDLWVTDPNGEKTYYSSPHSYQGGWLSHDCTGGYGPEEFILRDAKPGKYKVEANFFGERQQLVTGATTLQLHLFTGFGTPRQKDQSVTLRLKDAKESVLVGEFEVQ